MTDADELPHVVSRDGTRITYRRLGTGPPVAVVHGGLGSSLSWLPVAERLADRFDLLLVDRRGHGGSEAGPGRSSIEVEAEDVAAVLEIAGPGAALVGHSYGGVVGLEAARRAPAGAIGHLVVYEAPVQFDRFSSETIEHVLELNDNGEHEEALLVGLAQLRDDGGLRPPDVDAALALRPSPEWNRLVHGARSLGAELSAVSRFDRDLTRFAEIDVPTLIILGELSGELHQRSSTALALTLPQARLVRLESQGHLAHLQDPDQLARVLGDFFDA